MMSGAGGGNMVFFAWIPYVLTIALLAQIIKMVEQAQASKAPIQRLADLVSEFEK